MKNNWIWILAATLLACYYFTNKIVRNMNGWYYNFKLRKNQSQLLPPGDMGWPLLGHMVSYFKHFSSGHPNIFINNLILKYGDTGIYKSHLFGSPTVIVIDPEMCNKVLMDDTNFKFSYPEISKKVAPCRLLNSIVEHRRFKHLISRHIGDNILTMYFERIEGIMINTLEDLSSMKHPIEFLAEMKKVSLEVILHIFMGPFDQRIIIKFGDLFNEMIGGFFSIPINIPGLTLNKALKARKKLVKLVHSMIDERRMMMKKGEIKEKKYLVDILFEVNDENGDKLEDEEIIDLFVVVLAAGHETTATAMMWSLIYLSKYPNCLVKVKAEQEEIMKVRSSSQKHLSVKEIKQMVYLSKVIDEVLRHSNIAFAAFREATTDMNINGYFIPRGWKVIVWTRAIHMNPKHYSNPDNFDPSRWNDYNAGTKTFIPFGAGKRLCPGIDLARFEISIFLHYFILNYKLEQINPECSITHFPSPRPVDKCLAKVIKLSKA